MTVQDLIWIKNVTNSEIGQAYMNLDEDIFILHFPNQHKGNVLKPKIGEIIAIHQNIDKQKVFTHLVTPVDNILYEENYVDYKYGRKVKLIAKTDISNIIPISNTLWNNVNFGGISQGNACRIKNISNINNHDSLLENIWEKFAPFFRENIAYTNLNKVSELSIEQWKEILQNKSLTNEFDLSIFQTLYDFENHKACASDMAFILETNHSNINLEIWRYALRILEVYNINFTKRDNGKEKFWDFFFHGWEEGDKFIWQLKNEIIEALKACNLTSNNIYPEEIIEENRQAIFEGLKRTITVNAYERNPRARAICIKHWKAICAVCDFDFEAVYREIGKGFIHVHHIKPIAQIGESYEVDPIHDLIPVCPNCHAMLHKKNPPLSINELKSLMLKNKQN